jgi:hypothetical protein
MEDERKTEPDLKSEDTQRVTLAIAEKSVELAFCEGYRCALREISFIFVLAIVAITIARGLSEE